MITGLVKPRGFFLYKNRFLAFKFKMPDTKLRPHEQRFGRVNATNRNSYLNVICIKLVTQ